MKTFTEYTNPPRDKEDKEKGEKKKKIEWPQYIIPSKRYHKR